MDDGVWVRCGFLGVAGGMGEGCGEMEDRSCEDEGRNGREGAWRVMEPVAGWGDIGAGTCIIFRLAGSGVGTASE